MDKTSFCTMVEQKLEKSGIKTSRKQVAATLDAIAETLQESLAGGHTIAIYRFAKFSVTNRKSRKGYNPKTGDTVIVPAHKTVKIKIAKNFKDAINSK